MAKRKAKLVTFSVTTRIIVDDHLEDHEIAEKALFQAVNNLRNDGISDHLEEVVDDKECPFGKFEDDK